MGPQCKQPVVPPEVSTPFSSMLLEIRLGIRSQSRIQISYEMCSQLSIFPENLFDTCIFSLKYVLNCNEILCTDRNKRSNFFSLCRDGTGSGPS